MHQLATRRGRFFALLLAQLACLSGSALFAGADSTHSATAKPVIGDAATSDRQTPEKSEILFVLGLKDEANQLVKNAVVEDFDHLNVQQIEAGEAASPDYQWPDTGIIVTAGRKGCQLALSAAPHIRVLCTLLTEEGFNSLDTSKRSPNSPPLSALVIDQPVSRQMRVAHKIYPSLELFSVFKGSGAGVDTRELDAAISVFPFRPSGPLPPQLSEALSAHDALIATSDSKIFNRSTLSTVLLTAYGYGKPVIGFSRAYVKAGALLSCYSTPSQILRQVEQYLHAYPASSVPDKELIYPDYFSVVDNPRVATSLGLIQDFSITYGKTYTNADFKP